MYKYYKYKKKYLLLRGSTLYIPESFINIKNILTNIKEGYAPLYNELFITCRVGVAPLYNELLLYKLLSYMMNYIMNFYYINLLHIDVSTSVKLYIFIFYRVIMVIIIFIVI